MAERTAGDFGIDVVETGDDSLETYLAHLTMLWDDRIGRDNYRINVTDVKGWTRIGVHYDGSVAGERTEEANRILLKMLGDESYLVEGTERLGICGGIINVRKSGSPVMC